MRYIVFSLLMLVVLAGCATVLPKTDSAYIAEITQDAGEELKVLYPPARTRFVLLAKDEFGNELLQVLRTSGYAVNESRGNGITIGYVVDHQPEGDVLIRLYLGDDVTLTRLYRLNPPGRRKSCFPVGGWSRQEMKRAD